MQLQTRATSEMVLSVELRVYHIIIVIIIIG